jgi:hypothetical protein
MEMKPVSSSDSFHLNLDAAPPKHSLSTDNDEIVKIVHSASLTESNDLAGHGGTFQTSVVHNGQTHHLFLKPLQEVEQKNYDVLHEIAPDLVAFMPRIYGTTTIKGKEYLVQENLTKDTQGLSQTLLVEAKLSGKVDGKNFNPIVDQAEMHTTRGRAKGFFVNFFMGLGAKFAPNFMVRRGSGLTRLFNYRDSATNFLDTLKDSSPEHILKLKNDLEELQRVLSESPVALIGASILIIKQNDGSLRPVLIDPAHMQINPDRVSEKAWDDKLYFGTETQYKIQKQSNDIAITTLINAVDTKVINTVATPLLLKS